MHWHVKPQFIQSTILPTEDFVTYWCLSDAQVSVGALEDARQRLGYRDFRWATEECQDLECLIEEMAT